MADYQIKNWRGDEVKALIHAAMQQRLKSACIVVSRHAKELLSISGTGVFKAQADWIAGRAGRKRAAARARVYRKLGKIGRKANKKITRTTRIVGKKATRLRKSLGKSIRKTFRPKRRRKK